LPLFRSVQTIPRIIAASYSGIFPRDKHQGHKADHTLLSSAEVKNGWS